MRCLAPLGLLLLACGQPKSDAARYSEALGDAPDFDAAAVLCRGIEAPRLRGDCLVAVMARFESLDSAVCEALVDPLWLNECLFQLAERQGATGDIKQGLLTCDRTTFARKCGWHLVQDEAEASVEETMAEAEARVDAFLGARSVPDAAVQFWKIRFREQSALGLAMDETSCEGLRHPEVCREAVGGHVRDLLDALGRANLDRVCAAEEGVRATRKGKPAWLPGEVATAAERRWVRERCDRSIKDLPGQRRGGEGPLAPKDQAPPP